MDESRSAGTGVVSAPPDLEEPEALEWFECLDCRAEARCEACRQDARAEALRWLHDLSESFGWTGVLFPPEDE